MAVVQLSEDDHDRSIRVRRGDTMAIALAESPTTGFVWETALVRGCVVAAGDAFAMSSDSGKLGAGGVHTYSFNVVSDGDGRVELKLWRPWNGEASVARRFAIDIATT